MLWLPFDDFVEHAQGLLVVTLRRVDLGERDRGDGRGSLKRLQPLTISADRGGRVGQIQTGFDHAREQVARDAQPAA
jgi:hypothetical protein